MHLIVYTSHFTGNHQKISPELQEINRSAKRNNGQLGITGLLFYHHERFLQIIEGQQDNLESLMTKLQQDPRHEEIERLIDAPMKNRRFEKWNMDTFNLSDNQTIEAQELKLIADTYQENLVIDSQVIANFYRAMVNTRSIKIPPKKD